MMLNAKLNDTAQKIMWAEAVHTCERVRNSMAIMGSTTSPFENFYEKKQDHWFVLGIQTHRMRYQRGQVQEANQEKIIFKAIIVGYAENHTRDTYKFYNPETKKVVMTLDIQWANWKNTDPAQTLKMFSKAEKEDLLPNIEEDVIPTSKPEEKISVHVISDEG